MRLTRLQTVIFSLLVSLFTPLAFAHPGHDHEHWSSAFLHALFYASLFAAGAACAFAIYKVVTRRQVKGN